MLHVRLIVPPELRPAVMQLLLDDPSVIHLQVTYDASQRPNGDVVLFDIPRETASTLLAGLRLLSLSTTGAVILTELRAVFSETAREAVELAPGDPSEAVIWEEVKARVRAETVLTASWVALMTVAILIAAVGLLTDSGILIVGAMVVGPDYGPLAAAAIGLHLNQFSWIARGARMLAVGFCIAIPLAALLTIAIEVTGNTPASFVNNEQSATAFIARPDVFSVIVAVLAAIAGIMSLTQEKAGTLVGVLISVTTIPAAAAVGVYSAHGRWNDAFGSLAQLLLNLVVLVAVGGATLRVERLVHVRRRETRRRLLEAGAALSKV